MAFISDNNRQRIVEAIRQVEAKTRGEIVTVIARECDDYYYIPTLWAALSALFLPVPVMLFDLQETLLGNYGVQVVTFLLALMLFHLPAIKYRVIPKAVKRRRAARLAREQFLLQNLHHTEGRTGVLLFVGVAERYVEVIADKGINAVVPNGSWDWVVADFLAMVKTGDVAEGFVKAIKGIGTHLIEHFPAEEKNPNELPDHLIEL